MADSNSKPNKHRKETKRLIFWSIAGALIILLVWAISGAMIYIAMPIPDDHGTFGDLFGAINALFSGWAFLGVIIAIILQKLELEEQRRELRESSKAQQESAQALSKRLNLEEDLCKKQFTLSLFDEWHRPEYHESRINVDRMLEKLKKSNEPIPTLTIFENRSDDEAKDVFKIIHFFEKWARLARANQLDIKLLNDLLGSYTNFWKNSLLIPLNSDKEKNPDFITLLSEIDEYVFEKSL